MFVVRNKALRHFSIAINSPFLLPVDLIWHPHEWKKKAVLPEGIRMADIQRNASFRHLTCNKDGKNKTLFAKGESL